MNEISALLQEQVRVRPAATAVVEAGERTTFSELGAQVQARAAWFRSVGVGVGARVGVSVSSPATYLMDLHALLSLDALVVPLPPAMTAWERCRVEEVALLTHLVDADPSVAPFGRRVEARPGSSPPPVGGGIAQLTSGTTGAAKVALRSLDALVAEVRSYRQALELDPRRDSILCVLSLHHAYGSGLCALSAPLTGVPVTYAPPLPRAVLQVLARGATTLLPIVPTLLRVLAESSDDALALGGLRALPAGQLLDLRTAELAVTRLGVALVQVYGTSETGLLCVGEAGGAAEACASVGRPAPGVRVMIEPAGDVLVASDAMLSGYLAGDVIDRSGIEGGWLRTGDLGRLDGDGRLSLTGRRSCALNVAGVKVSPEEVEAAILEFPAVDAVLVSGAGGGPGVERVKAVVTPATVDLVALRAFCRERLSGPRLPTVYEAVDALETTATGKVVRPIAATP